MGLFSIGKVARLLGTSTLKVRTLISARALKVKRDENGKKYVSKRELQRYMAEHPDEADNFYL